MKHCTITKKNVSTLLLHRRSYSTLNAYCTTIPSVIPYCRILSLEHISHWLRVFHAHSSEYKCAMKFSYSILFHELKETNCIKLNKEIPVLKNEY